MKTTKIIITAFLSAAAICLSGCAVSITNAGSIGSTVNYPNADKYTAGDREIKDEIHALDIAWPSGAVKVSAASGKTVSVKETTAAKLTDDLKVHSWTDGGVLRVRFCKSGSSYQNPEPKTVEITVPESIRLEDVGISVASADVDCSGLSAKNADLSAASGKLQYTGTAERFRSSASSGNISFSGESDEISATASSGAVEIAQRGKSDCISVDTSSGRISIDAEQTAELTASSSSGEKDIRLKEVPQKMRLTASSGDVTLTLPEKSDFTADINTASGSVSYDLQMSKEDGNTYVCGSGVNKVTIDTSSGNVSILKN